MGMKEFNPLEVIPVRSSKAERWDEVEEVEVMWLLLLLFVLLFLFSMLGICMNSETLLKSWAAGKERLRSWPSWILGFWAEDWEQPGGTRSGSFFDEAEDEDEEEEDDDLLFFLEPPPTGIFLRDPPSVQYLLQALQKYLGWERL